MIIDEMKKERLRAIRVKDKFTNKKLAFVISECERLQDTSDKTMIKRIQVTIKNVRETLKHVEAGSFQAQELVNEIMLLEKYLPKEVDAATLKTATWEAFMDSHTKSMKEMGYVMGALKSRFPGMIIQGQLVSKYMKEFTSAG